MKTEYKKIILKSGARLILVPDNSKQVATSLVMFGVGSRNEMPEEAGISHVLEHMFFKGSKKRPTATEIAEFIEGIGGENNAFTSKEYTGFYTKTAAKHLDKSIDFLSDLLGEPLFDPKELEKEKGVIVQELKMYEDLPMEVVANKFETALFGNNALGRDVIGRKESIEVTSQKLLFEYKNRHYTGPNTVVVLAGNFGDRSEMELTGLVEKSFVFESPSLSELPELILNSKKSKLVVKRDTEQAHLILGFPGAKYTDSDRYALRMLALILGGSMSSRMFTEIREKRGLAYAVRTQTSNYKETGSIETYAGVPNEKVPEAILAILEEYKKIKSGVEPAELSRAKEMISGRMLIGLEDTNEIASHFATSELMTGEIISPDEAVSMYQRLTEKNLLDAANKYLNFDHLAMSYVGNGIEEDELQKIFNF